MDTLKTQAKAFAEAATKMAAALGDQLKTQDPEAHAKLEEALAAGHSVAVSVVSNVHGQSRIELDLVGPAGRMTVVGLSAQTQARH